MKTAATAWFWGIARCRQARDQPDFNHTSATRDGHGPADHGGQGQHDDEGGEAGVLADRMERRAQTEGDEDLAAERATENVGDLAGLDGDGLDVLPDGDEMRLRLLARQSPDPGDQRDHRDDDGDGEDADEDDPDDVLVPAALGWSTVREKSPTANGRQTMNRTPLTTQLAVPAMAPELIAAGASSPWRWKNRTRTPNTAASPPTKEVNMFDVSRATQRPNGSGPMTAPVSAQAPVTTGSWPEDEGGGHPRQGGAADDASDPDASVRTPMISHSPTMLPMTINKLGQLIRFASTSFGTSTPAAVASDSRRVFKNPFCVRAMRSVSGSSVERCRRVRTAWIVAVSRTRQVAATARSTPTTTAAAAPPRRPGRGRSA